MVSDSGQKSIEIMVQKLKGKGYEVVIEPSPAEIPFELPDYQPDLLATKGDENLIIEIKSKNFPRSIERYKAISDIISRQSNWRFMLSTIDDNYQDEGVQLTVEANTESVTKLLTKLELILDSESSNLALPYLWTAYISGMRIVGQRKGIPIDAVSDKSVLNYMYSLGEISNEEYSKALSYLSLRNAMVHSLDIEISKDQMDEVRFFIIHKLVEWELVSQDFLKLHVQK